MPRGGPQGHECFVESSRSRLANPSNVIGCKSKVMVKPVVCGENFSAHTERDTFCPVLYGFS
jgi:hypothetical protein